MVALDVAARRAKSMEKGRAGAEKIHELRHTLGTLAGKRFSRGMVQAIMGHLSPKSSDPYFHPDEDMAAEVRQKIITDLSPISQILLENERMDKAGEEPKKQRITCPCCDGKGFIYKNN